VVIATGNNIFTNMMQDRIFSDDCLFIFYQVYAKKIVKISVIFSEEIGLYTSNN